MTTPAKHSALDDFAVHLGAGKTLYTKARGTKFRAFVSGGVLVIESERSGRSTFKPTTVAAAVSALASGESPSDRGTQVARSWVAAIQDSMAGRPNTPRASASRSATRPAGKERSSAGRSTKSAGPRAAKRPRRRSPKGRPSTRNAIDPSEIALQIGREIANALGKARDDASDPRTELDAIGEKLAELNAEVERQLAERVELDDRLAALVAGKTSVEEELARAKRENQSWRSAAVLVAGVANAVVVPAAAAETVSEIAELLAQAARIWKSAPTGSVAASRSALELSLRTAAANVSGGSDHDREPFAAVHQYLMSRLTTKGNLPDSDLFLARDLYRRSSKAGHNEPNWRPDPLEALLVWAGVAVLARRAGAA